jgi:hypothetical protein
VKWLQRKEYIHPPDLLGESALHGITRPYFDGLCNLPRLAKQTGARKRPDFDMQNASLEGDDNLQDKWAALLANAADPTQATVLPAFPEILRQLSNHDARFLSRLYRLTNDEKTLQGDTREYLGLFYASLRGLRPVADGRAPCFRLV